MNEVIDYRYILKEEILSEEDMKIFAISQKFCKKVFEDAEVGSIISCHQMTRLFSIVLNSYGYPDWNVADGYFSSRGTEHSWLWKSTDTSRPDTTILDLYPVAAIGPIMAHIGPMSPWNNLYHAVPWDYSSSQKIKWEKDVDDFYDQLRDKIIKKELT
jgi:hypothetical protein